MILNSLRVPAAEFSAVTGWDAKPEGMCRGEVCVPAPGALDNGQVNVEVAAARLGMPVVHDSDHGVWSLGAATATGRTLATAVARFPSTLIDAMGRGFDFASLRGRRIIMIAWASW
ncbi:MAG: hypothetical protein FGM42_01195 [Ilumatobacteraceae bacterium]|nr:hypothetical protein [Ilumatobacteraceae bacterium]MBU6242287.1 hypothetical protein [Acidobacteriota bacterium]